jgi:CHAD domain-containing protein
VKTEPHRLVASLVTGLLSQRLDRFEALADAVADTTDAEAIHDIRVGSRRFHAALMVLSPLARFPRDIRRRPVRRLERRFGALRDLDVLSGMLDELPASSEAEALRATILAERQSAAERGRVALARRSLRRACASLHEWLDDPEFSPLASMDPELLLPELVAPAVNRFFLHPGWQVSNSPSPLEPGAEALHALRRRIKPLRYGLECFAPWCDEPVGQWLSELHLMQDALGNWHDAGVLLERLEGVRAGAELRDLARSRAALALEPWLAWRERYTEPEFRRTARSWVDRVRPDLARE